MTPEDQERPAARILRIMVLMICENARIGPHDLECMERVTALWPDKGAKD